MTAARQPLKMRFLHSTTRFVFIFPLYNRSASSGSSRRSFRSSSAPAPIRPSRTNLAAGLTVGHFHHASIAPLHKDKFSTETFRVTTWAIWAGIPAGRNGSLEHKMSCSLTCQYCFLGTGIVPKLILNRLLCSVSGWAGYAAANVSTVRLVAHMR